MERVSGTQRVTEHQWDFRGMAAGVLLLCGLFSAFIYAESPNHEPYESIPPPGEKGQYLDFDPNDYQFLIYDTQGDQSSILDAMGRLGISCAVRDKDDSVTLDDLANYDILIVGWNEGGQMGGLNASVLGAGITGRIVLTGHDADYHTASGESEQPAAERFFSQAINYVLKDEGTGLLAMGDPSAGFSWLPAAWGITANQDTGEIIKAFTPEGDYSGIFEGLTPGAMSHWDLSYHNWFSGWGEYFAPLEMGGENGDKAITIGRARQFGFHLEKDDGVEETESVLPTDEITYTIRFYSLTDVDDVYIVDTLSPAVDYDGFDWQTMTYDPNYNPNTHTYTWHIEHLDAYDPNEPVDPNEVLTLTVTVNHTADPMGVILNQVEAAGPVYAYAEVLTPVGCFGGDVIYVDGSKPAGGNGTGWTMAYRDLQDALARARIGCGDEIWIAKGTYKPGTAYNSTFEIPDNVSVYGGFAGNETSLEERNWTINQTILSGYIGKDEFQNDLRNQTVVTMGNISLLDGVTVREGAYPGRGILGQNVDFTIDNCIIEDNLQFGIQSENSNATIKWSNIQNNGFDGIYHLGIGKIISIENCRVFDNGQNGIQSYYSTPSILNCIIYRNGTMGTSFYGIYLNQPSAVPTIRNNTIVDNQNEGIRSVGTTYPLVQNCILYANHADGGYVDYSGFWTTQNCCLTDANDLQRTATPTGSNGNLRGNPVFAYSDISLGNFHLSYTSPCKNAGSNTGVGIDETDMDQDERILDSTVEIGADEVACEDVSHPLDYNADGIVNYGEFELFSRAWLTHDPNDPQMPPGIDPNDFVHWNPQCDLDLDYDVDLEDIVIFADYQNGFWLWVACWKQSDIQMIMESMSVLQANESLTARSAELQTDSLITFDPLFSQDIFLSKRDPLIEKANVRLIIEDLDLSIQKGHENQEGILEIMAYLDQMLLELDSTVLKE